MTDVANELAIFVPGTKKNVVPFMRDVFTIPTGRRDKPRLIGSVCRECEEYFFPKTGAKATCDNPFCPRSTSEVLLSGKGKILSATVMRDPAGEGKRVSAVILLEEGIKINSHLIGWLGFEDLLVPGSPVEIVLQEMEETEEGETVVGYAFRLVTGRRKPKLPAPEEGKKEAKKKAPAPAGDGKMPQPAPAPEGKKEAGAEKAKAESKKSPPKPKPAPKKKAAKPKPKPKKKPAPKKKAAKPKPKPKKKPAPKKKAVKPKPKKKAAAKAKKKTKAAKRPVRKKTSGGKKKSARPKAKAKAKTKKAAKGKSRKTAKKLSRKKRR